MKDKNASNSEDKIRISLPLNKKLLIYVAAIAVIIALVYAVVNNPGSLGDVIGYVVNILLPILIGFVLAYIINLILRPLERFWDYIWRNLKSKKVTTKIKRPVCLFTSFLLFLSVICAILFMLVPAISNTVVSFVNKIPEYTKVVEKGYNETVDFFAEYNIELPPWTEESSLLGGNNADTPKDESSTESGKTTINKNVLFDSGMAIFNTTASLFSILVDICLGFVFAAYLLAKKERFGSQCRKAINAILKPKSANRLFNVASLTNDAFTGFITGQLTEACLLAVLCLIGMLIFGMPNAGIISVLVGFMALIPIFGAFISAGVGAFLILLEDPILAIWFVVFMIVLQQLESNLIYPRVVGKSVGLPGVLVLAAVTIGGGIFGVVGMLFSVPVCSVIYALFKEFVKKQEQQDAKEKEAIEISSE